MVDPLQLVIAEVEMLLTKLHALKPQIQQSLSDAQEVQQDVKEGIAGVPIDPKANV